MSAYERDQKTSRTVSGVWVKAGHWASSTVHAFRRWTGETELVTWCGISVNLADGGAHTRDHITCLQCPQASLQAFRGAA
ncbi:MAG: hypothetical protein IT306_14700 [Chloroflexi bacterium]|nr:hypothetical protein [Chloroflexota bacterium]